MFRLYEDSVSMPTQFYFSLSVQQNENYIRYSALYYTIGFVLDGFVHLWADASVLSTFKVGG